jgi:hypothetical protein
MKRIVASVGLVALGTSGLQADTASSLTSESTKPWSVSATLRGFYDDNINSVSDNSSALSVNGERYHRGAFGFDVSPAVMVSWPWEQTTLSMGYVYTFRDYQFKPIGNTDTVDMTHSFNISLDHTFNELYQAKITDSFVVGQDPDFLRAGNTYSTFQRLPGDNIRNYGNATFDGKLTPLLGFEVGYANAYYNYAADQPATLGGVYFPSEGGLLNRMEQTVHLDSRWQFTPETVGIVGYQFTDIDYYESQEIAPAGPGSGGLPYTSNARNNYGHYGYVGVDQVFRPDLTGSLRVGARYTDYYNDPAASSEVTPFVQLSLRWNYGMESYVEGGFTHDRAATDLVGNGISGLTLDSETSCLFLSVRNRLAPNLYGSLTGDFQNSAYNGGEFNSVSEQFYTFGANLEYRVSNYLATQLGYNYDRLESEIAGRSFDRNRVYLGVTASY